MEIESTVTNCVKEVLKYLSDLSIKHKAIAEEYDNSSMSMAAIGAMKLIGEKKELSNYLTTLDYEMLLKIEAIMFFGKFTNQNINEKYKMCVDMEQTKDDIVEQIVDLAPACESYFEYAIQQAKQKGINLDNL